MKSAAERRVEAMAWAAVVIWLGLSLLAGLLSMVWLVVMVLSIILLSSAIYQRSQGWHTSLSIWMFGIWMAVFSVIEFVDELVAALSGGEGLNIDLWVYLGVALISMGVATVLRTIQMPSLATGDKPVSRQRVESARDRTTRSRADDRQRRAYVPRRIEEGQSTSLDIPPEDQGRTARTETPRPERTQRVTPVESRRPGRATSARKPSQPARRAPEPSNLEQRVEDIIRRSRERRGQDADSTDDLPY